MCGIFAMISKKNLHINKFLLNGIKQLQNRGYDSAGICTVSENSFEVIKYASENVNAISKIEQQINIDELSTLGIAHTRWATHGGKTDDNSHPHVSYDGKIYLVHNGIIENFDTIKKFLISKNISFQSQTDTEVIANLLAYNYQQNPDFTEALQQTLNELQGTWGLVILNVDYLNTMFCVKHGSPLLIGENDDYVMATSEQSGFHGMVNNYFVLESNDICKIRIKDDRISIRTEKKYKTKDILQNNFKLTPDPFPHWTISEIHEQIESVKRAISFGGRLLNTYQVRLGGLDDNIEILRRIDNLILLGCGTSYFAGMIGVKFLKDLTDLNTISLYDGAEFTAHDIPKIGNTAVILLSQSGETLDLHRCISISREHDLFLIGVVNVVDSLIAREVDCGCYLNAGREVGVASTKAFTSQVVILSMISIWFAQMKKINKHKRRKYINCLRQLPKHFEDTISSCSQLREIYISFFSTNHLFILGKNKSEAIAKEGSLKIKEISYIHAEGYPGSSLKHGPFALLCKDFPVVLVMPNNSDFDKMKNAYQEIKSRDAKILCITDNDMFKSDHKISIPHNEIFSDLLCIIPIQFAAYFLSVHKGYNPDQPRNLAKVVTVE
jgi:glutamine---fructose-6-phosphate transaminase (isomerizing)